MRWPLGRQAARAAGTAGLTEVPRSANLFCREAGYLACSSIGLSAVKTGPPPLAWRVSFLLFYQGFQAVAVGSDVCSQSGVFMLGKFRCPICEREVDDPIIPFHKNVERQILESIRRRHPRWIEADGSSPKSVDFYKALVRNKLLK